MVPWLSVFLEVISYPYGYSYCVIPTGIPIGIPMAPWLNVFLKVTSYDCGAIPISIPIRIPISIPMVPWLSFFLKDTITIYSFGYSYEVFPRGIPLIFPWLVA